MSVEANRAQIRRLFEAGFRGEPFTVADFVDESYVDHSPIPAPAPGTEGFGQRMARLRAAFVDDVRFGPFLAEGELVAFTWELVGVHRGPFAGIQPTGRPVTLAGINVERLDGGRIVEHWSQFDLAGLVRVLSAP